MPLADLPAAPLRASPRWSFANPVASQFEQHAEQSIPGYRESQDLVVSVSEFFAESTIVELGCATGSLSRRLAERLPSCSVSGIDNEADMVAQATATHNDVANLTFRCADVRTDSIRAPGSAGVDVVVAHHVLQFLLPHERIQVLGSVFDALRPGGALVIFEKCRASGGVAMDIGTQLYHEFKLRSGLTADEVLAKAAALRGVLHPLTVAESDAALRSAGSAARRGDI